MPLTFRKKKSGLDETSLLSSPSSSPSSSTGHVDNNPQSSSIKSSSLGVISVNKLVVSSLICVCYWLHFRVSQMNVHDEWRNTSSSVTKGVPVPLSIQDLFRDALANASTPQFAPLMFPTDKTASFSSTCPTQLHTYHIMKGKVHRISSGYTIHSRSRVMHCLLARAAHRNPTLNVKLRIGLGDQDLNTPFSFQPASPMNIMNTTHAPLLFPDTSFESWPEVNDYSLPLTVASIWTAAQAHGLPGTAQWVQRKPQVVWRGSRHGNVRQATINASRTASKFLLDVQATGWNMTRTEGFKLTSPIRISRDEHCQYRFLLHMNGVFNDRYSSAVKWKMLCGSLVFVPTNPMFVEWWNYNVWEPYVHYLPYTSPEDLLERIAYYNHHLDEAAEIARRGMQLAQHAFYGFEDFVDSALLEYAQRTKDLNQADCFADPKGIPETLEPKTLEEVKQEYGPTVCA